MIYSLIWMICNNNPDAKLTKANDSYMTIADAWADNWKTKSKETRLTRMSE